MIEIRTGSNRRVLLTQRYAFKFPRLRHPICGNRSNRWEREMWRHWRPVFGWDTLCPVIFADPLGIVVVMPRVTEADSNAIEAAIEKDSEFYPQPTTEFMAAGYGVVDGRAVCFDYGLADADMVRERRNYYVEHAGRNLSSVRR